MATLAPPDYLQVTPLISLLSCTLAQYEIPKTLLAPVDIQRFLDRWLDPDGAIGISTDPLSSPVAPSVG